MSSSTRRKSPYEKEDDDYDESSFKKVSNKRRKKTTPRPKQKQDPNEPLSVTEDLVLGYIFYAVVEEEQPVLTWRKDVFFRALGDFMDDKQLDEALASLKRKRLYTTRGGKYMPTDLAVNRFEFVPPEISETGCYWLYDRLNQPKESAV